MLILSHSDRSFHILCKGSFMNNSIQPMGQPQSPLINAFSKLSTILSFLLTILIAPSVFTYTKSYVSDFIYQQYGSTYVEWAVIGWAVLCALLLYRLINFVLQSFVMAGAVSLAKRLV